MAIISAAELKRIEARHQSGITSSAVVKIFQDKGERFSEATLRKYVQLGLLPTSRRVGIRGRHRGSSGLYPVIIVRLANEIKRALEKGSTLEDVRIGSIGLVGEVEVLRRAADTTFRRITDAVERAGKNERAGLRKSLAHQKKSLDQLIKSLQKWVSGLGREG